MILLELFWSFLQIGLFSIGGGYAAMPLIQSQAVTQHAWLTMAEFGDLVTIAEMTPGPIAINAATFVGYRSAGVLGSVCATLGVVLPSFTIILIISGILREFQENTYVQYAFRGIRAGVLALIVKAMWGMYKKCNKNAVSHIVMAAAFVLVGLGKLPVFPVLIGCAVFGLVTSIMMDRRAAK